MQVQEQGELLDKNKSEQPKYHSQFSTHKLLPGPSLQPYWGLNLFYIPVFSLHLLRPFSPGKTYKSKQMSFRNEGR